MKFQKLSMVSGDQGELPEFWSASDAASLKYCPVQSADVDLSEANQQKMMICNCFYNRD